MFATSTLLLPMSKLGMSPETMPLLRSVEMGVEILEAMEESVVARKSVEIIRQYLRDFRATGAPQSGEAEVPAVDTAPGQGFEVPVRTLYHPGKKQTNAFRNGPMGSDSRIILSRELRDYLTMLVVSPCWMSSFECILLFLNIVLAQVDLKYELQNLTPP